VPQEEILAIDLTVGMGSDDLLVSRIGEGDTDAFWILWERHEAVVRRVCVDSFGKRTTEAEDAYAAVRLKALVKLRAQARSVRNARGWLIGLARNHCSDVHRKEAPERQAFTHAVVQMPEPIATESGAVMTWFQDLDAALKSLSPALLEGLLGRFQKGQNYRELAVSLNVPEAALRKRVQRARQRLSKALSCGPGVELEDLLTYLASQREPVVNLTAVTQRPERREVRDAVSVVGISVRTASGVRDCFLPSDHRARALPVKAQKLEEYLLSHSRAWRSRAELAHLHLLMGDLDAAESGLGACLHHASATQVCVDHALLLLAKGRSETAAAFDRASAVSRDAGLAAVLEFQGRALRECSGLSMPQFPRLAPGALSLLAAGLSEMEQDGWAAQLAEEYPEPDAATASFLARCLRRAGRMREAERMSSLAYDADPANPLACIEYDLHRILAGRNAGPAGRRTLSIATNLFQEAPHLGEAAILLSLCHLARCEEGEATEVLESFLKREPAHGKVILANSLLRDLRGYKKGKPGDVPTAALIKLLFGRQAIKSHISNP